MSTINRSARLLAAVSVGVVLAVLASGDMPLPAGEVEVGAAVAVEVQNQQANDTIHIIAAEISANLPEHNDGAVLVESVCTACHSLQPPPTLAPPLNMVVRHYMEEFADRAEVEESIARWVVAPDPEKSGMPAHAIERFGLMPPIPLTEAQRDAVAAYLVETYGDAAMGGHMRGGMDGHMQGGMRERMRRRGGGGNP